MFNGPAPKGPMSYRYGRPQNPEDQARDLEKRWSVQGKAFGYIHPVMGEYVKSVFKRYAPLAKASFKTAKHFVYIAGNQRDVFKMHPALVVKLARTRVL